MSNKMRKLMEAIEPTGQDKWGFDLTDIPAEKWTELLGLIGYERSTPVTSEKGHQWPGEGVLIVTANNPITGEYYLPNRRGREKGYASYIGIQGDADKVKMVADFIRTYGDYKDEEPHSRGFI